MAGRPYSERFLAWAGSGYSPYYTVPVGQRAILKSLVAYNNSSTPISIVLEVQGNIAWSVTVPGGQGGVSPPFMLVLYAGERLRLYQGSSTAWSGISGYLLAG